MIGCVCFKPWHPFIHQENTGLYFTFLSTIIYALPNEAPYLVVKGGHHNIESYVPWYTNYYTCIVQHLDGWRPSQSLRRGSGHSQPPEISFQMPPLVISINPHDTSSPFVQFPLGGSIHECLRVLYSLVTTNSAGLLLSQAVYYSFILMILKGMNRSVSFI